MYANDLTWVLLPIVIAVALFFIFRSVLLWYWKVNAVVKNQELTNEILKKIYKQMGGTESFTVCEEMKTDEERIETLKISLKMDQVIVKNTKTDTFSAIKKDQWISDEKMGYNFGFEKVYDPSEKCPES